MKILKLTKVKLGDSYPIIRVTYKSWFKIKQRDAIKKAVLWEFMDNGQLIFSEALDLFNESSEYEYILNK